MPRVAILDVPCNWNHEGSTASQRHSKITVLAEGQMEGETWHSPSLHDKERNVTSLPRSQQQLALLGPRVYVWKPINGKGGPWVQALSL